MATNVHRHDDADAARAGRVAPPAWACPDDREALEARGDELVCPGGHRFPVVEGIPRFVSGRTYSDAFGLQWRRYRRTQLDSETGTTISRDRARRCLGDAFDRLDRSDVLECGCGAGRFTEVLLAQGARVTSVDLSDAVEANQETFPQDGRHRIAQADIARLPFAPRQFDVVFCLGVVQHTPDPEATIAALYDHVRPGGLLVVDHYRRNLGWRLSTQPLARAVLRRLSPDRGLRATDAIVRMLFPLHRRVRRFERLVTRVSPVQTYFTTLPELDDEAQRAWALVDTHDSLTDWFKHFRSVDEIRERLRALGAADVDAWRGGNGVEARARRPLE